MINTAQYGFKVEGRAPSVELTPINEFTSEQLCQMVVKETRKVFPKDAVIDVLHNSVKVSVGTPLQSTITAYHQAGRKAVEVRVWVATYAHKAAYAGQDIVFNIRYDSKTVTRTTKTLKSALAQAVKEDAESQIIFKTMLDRAVKGVKLGGLTYKLTVFSNDTIDAKTPIIFEAGMRSLKVYSQKVMITEERGFKYRDQTKDITLDVPAFDTLYGMLDHILKSDVAGIGGSRFIEALKRDKANVEEDIKDLQSRLKDIDAQLSGLSNG